MRKYSIGLALILLITLTSISFIKPASAATTDTRFNTCFSSEADVLRLYFAIFNRNPDKPGGDYWIAQLRKGKKLNDIAYWMSQGREYKTKYGNVNNNSALVDKFYRNIFKRTPDTKGKKYWVDQLQKGVPKHLVVRWMAMSPELAKRHPYAVKDCTYVYKNCTDVWNKLGRRIYSYEPGYGFKLDRDQNGIGCESDPR